MLPSGAACYGAAAPEREAMLKENQKDALRAFKTELRTRAQEERAAARRKAQTLRLTRVKEAQAETWEQTVRGVTPLR